MCSITCSIACCLCQALCPPHITSYAHILLSRAPCLCCFLPCFPAPPLPQLCNMDRVNMSIAILPISQQYQWSSATIGLVQSSFFWGYLLTQVGNSMAWLGQGWRRIRAASVGTCAS
jgi:hypothetical protein